MNEGYKDNMEVEFELVMEKISNDGLAKSLEDHYIDQYVTWYSSFMIDLEQLLC